MDQNQFSSHAGVEMPLTRTQGSDTIFFFTRKIHERQHKMCRVVPRNSQGFVVAPAQVICYSRFKPARATCEDCLYLGECVNFKASRSIISQDRSPVTGVAILANQHTPSVLVPREAPSDFSPATGHIPPTITVFPLVGQKATPSPTPPLPLVIETYWHVVMHSIYFFCQFRSATT